MSEDALSLWAAVCALAFFVASGGLALTSIGVSRRRSVSTGAARQVLALAASVGAALVVTRLVFDHDGDQAVLLAGASAFFSTVVLAASTERLTTLATVIVAGVVGALLPSMVEVVHLEWPDRVDVDGRTVDVGALIGAIAVGAGAMAVVVSALTGPRLGRFGRGEHRLIPGWSVPVAAVGTIIGAPSLAVASSGIAVSVLGESLTADDLIAACLSGVSAAVAGTFVGGLVGLGGSGRIGATSAIRGAWGGTIAAAAWMIDEVWWLGAIAGVVGAVAALLGHRWATRARIDDPVGVIGAFGSAGATAVLLPGFWGGGYGVVDGGVSDQLIAQIVALVAIVGSAVVAATVVGGILRAVRLLRIDRRTEIVGLDDIRDRRVVRRTIEQ